MLLQSLHSGDWVSSDRSGVRPVILDTTIYPPIYLSSIYHLSIYLPTNLSRSLALSLSLSLFFFRKGGGKGNPCPGASAPPPYVTGKLGVKDDKADLVQHHSSKRLQRTMEKLCYRIRLLEVSVFS